VGDTDRQTHTHTHTHTHTAGDLISLLSFFESRLEIKYFILKAQTLLKVSHVNRTSDECEPRYGHSWYTASKMVEQLLYIWSWENLAMVYSSISLERLRKPMKHSGVPVTQPRYELGAHQMRPQSVTSRCSLNATLELPLGDDCSGVEQLRMFVSKVGSVRSLQKEYP
jgi:hypothetical protein